MLLPFQSSKPPVATESISASASRSRIAYLHHHALGSFHYGPRHPMKPARHLDLIIGWL